MKIAVIAPLLIEVPPKNFGFGAQEYIIYEIVKGLVGKGHDVTLFASGDSNTKAKLVPVVPKSLNKEGKLKHFEREMFEMMGVMEASMGDFDVINNHILPFGLLFKNMFKGKVVHTLHHEIHKDRPEASFYRQFRNSNFISISNAQRNIMPELNYVATIHNSVDSDFYTYNEHPKGDYFLSIGRMKRYKGIHNAIQTINNLGLKLKVVAPMPIEGQNDYEEVMEYWRDEIEPKIGGNIEYFGAMSGKEKVEIISNAKAMLFPVEREEPFGMTIIESLSCGTPVVAYNRGATKEIMQGLEEYVVETREEMEEKVRQINNMDESDYASLRQKCRKLIEDKFRLERMVNEYEALFKKIVN